MHVLIIGPHLHVCCAAAAASSAGVEGEESMSAALHKVVHEVLGDELTLTEAKQMLAEVDARNAGKLSLSEVRRQEARGDVPGWQQVPVRQPRVPLLGAAWCVGTSGCLTSVYEPCRQARPVWHGTAAAALASDMLSSCHRAELAVWYPCAVLLPCCPVVLQFTEMVMGGRRPEGVSSPRTNGATSSKAGEVAAAAGGQDDTAMVK